MSFLTKYHNQTATLWVEDGLDSLGDFTYSAPTTITVRWEDKNERFIDNTGEEARSRAVIFLGQDVSPGDYLFLGTSIDSDPVIVDNAFKVKAFMKIPSFKSGEFERKAFL